MTIATYGGTRVADRPLKPRKHPSSIYRTVQNLGAIVELDDGDVYHRVWEYREEIRSLVESAEYAIESCVDRIQH